MLRLSWRIWAQLASPHSNRPTTTKHRSWFSNVWRCTTRRVSTWSTRRWRKETIFKLILIFHHRKFSPFRMSTFPTTTIRSITCRIPFKNRFSDTIWGYFELYCWTINGQSWLTRQNMYNVSTKWLKSVPSGDDELLQRRQVALMCWIMAIFSCEICCSVRRIKKFPTFDL